MPRSRKSSTSAITSSTSTRFSIACSAKCKRNEDFPMPIVNRIAALTDDMAAWRHDLHEHPELLYEVHRTAGIVADRLREFGCDEVVTGIGRTGVVGVIRGRKAASGKTIGLRADMDALPMDEMSGVPYASKRPGTMTAHGQDGHTAP